MTELVYQRGREKRADGVLGLFGIVFHSLNLFLDAAILSRCICGWKIMLWPYLAAIPVIWMASEWTIGLKKCWGISCRPPSHSSKASSSSSSCSCHYVVSWLHTHDQHTLGVYKAICVCGGFFFFCQHCRCRYLLILVLNDLHLLIPVLENSPLCIFILTASVGCWNGPLMSIAADAFMTLWVTWPYDTTARNGHRVAHLCQLCQCVHLFSALLFNGSSLLHIVLHQKHKLPLKTLYNNKLYTLTGFKP